MLNEIEASRLSDTEFKTMVMKKHNEFSVNYGKLQGNYEELTANCIGIEKDIGTIK